MPPTSTALYQEGAQIVSLFIVRDGVFNRDELYQLMVEEPAKFDGCSGCRCFGDVESDLKAVSLGHQGKQRKADSLLPANLGQPQGRAADWQAG